MKYLEINFPEGFYEEEGSGLKVLKVDEFKEVDHPDGIKLPKSFDPNDENLAVIYLKDSRNKVCFAGHQLSDELFRLTKESTEFFDNQVFMAFLPMNQPRSFFGD